MTIVLIGYALFVPFWLYCFYRCIRFISDTIKEFSPSDFNFYITDMWTAIVGLLPSYLLIRELYFAPHNFLELKVSSQNILVTITPLDAGIFTLSQMFGILIGRLFSIRRSEERIPRRIDQAIWVISGAWFFGPLLLAAITALFFLLSFFISSIVWCPPLFILSLFIAAIRMFQKKTR